MTSTALGTWSKPPLAYVVAELVISPYYSMAKAIPGLQDWLREAYPRTIEAQEMVLDGNKPSPQPVWRLLSADQKLGVQLGTRSISLHATSYLHSSDFLTRWAEVLDAVGAAKLGAFVERAGLRYVDLIVPAVNRTPSDYLEPCLRGVVLEGAESTGSMWVASFQFDDAIVNMKTSAPAPKGMLMPPDFNALPLAKPKVMHDAESRMKEGGVIGFIDTDCLKEVQSVFNASEITDTYKKMQKLTSKTFKATLSKVGKGEWV